MVGSEVDTIELEPYDAVIIGGGFFGCRIALHLRKQNQKVLLLEREPSIMKKASFANQARVHGGYHYPRSLLTALRSRVNLPQFAQEYEECIDNTFSSHYAISRQLSKVNARQFVQFCERIGAAIKPVNPRVKKFFNYDVVEEAFEVVEYAFNASKISQRLSCELEEADIHLHLGAEAEKLHDDGNGLKVIFKKNQSTFAVKASRVFNCSYSALNRTHRKFNLPLLPLKHELTEIALVEMPTGLKDVGITVMCGPFFSCMPFPALGLHSLTHVRYTPHFEWRDDDPMSEPPQPESDLPRTAYRRMLADAKRFMPIMEKAKYDRSLWEIKTVLTSSEENDSRPILYRSNYGLPGYTCIMGGKIDNIYDVLKELEPAWQTK